jgi:ABC-type glycerol-3-phosphate transport system permease component
MKVIVWLVILVLVLLILTPGIMGICYAFHSETATFTPTKIECVNTNQTKKYLVFTEGETLCISDSWVHWRFNSSDVYGSMKVGVKYTATLQGYRWPFLSTYRNIVNPVEVKVEK